MNKGPLNKKKAEFYLRVRVSSFEAAMLVHIREYEFGRFEIIKQYGEPRKIKKVGDEILKESDAYKLQVHDLKEGQEGDLFTEDSE